jgi:WD40 repeat protein
LLCKDLPVSVADFFPDGQSILVKSGDRLLALGLDGKVVREFASGAQGVGWFPFTPDGKSVLVGGLSKKTIPILSVPDGRVIGALEGGQDECGLGMRICADGSRAVTWFPMRRPHSDVTVWLWDLPNRRLLREFKRADGWLPPVAISPEGRRMVISRGSREGMKSEGRHMVLLELPDAKEVREVCINARRVEFTPQSGDRHVFYVGDSKATRGECLALLDLETGSDVFRLDFAQTSPGLSFAFSPNGQYVLSAEGWSESRYDDDTIELKLWDARTGELIRFVR